MPLLKPGQPIRTTGNNLVGLWRPSFVKVDHRLFVYGGGGNVTSDLHVLNLCDMRWETIQVGVEHLSPFPLPPFPSMGAHHYTYSQSRSCRSLSYS